MSRTASSALVINASRGSNRAVEKSKISTLNQDKHQKLSQTIITHWNQPGLNRLKNILLYIIIKHEKFRSGIN